MAIVLNDYHVHSCWAFHLGSKFLQTGGSWTLIYMNPFSSLLLVRVHLVFSVYKGVQFHIDPCTSFRILVKSLIREPYQPRTYQQRSHSPHHLSTRTPIHTLKSYSELTKSTQPIRATHTKPPTNYTPNTQSHTTKSLTMITWNACHISSSLPCIMETIQAYPLPPPPPNHHTHTRNQIPKFKSTQYIDTKFVDYKTTYNNTCVWRPHTQYTPTWGGSLTMIHKFINLISTSLLIGRISSQTLEQRARLPSQGPSSAR